jgi:hypothetical protein
MHPSQFILVILFKILLAVVIIVFEVSTVMIHVVVFWFMTLCILISEYQHSE